RGLRACRAGARGTLVGERAGAPGEPAAARAVGEDLYRRVVVAEPPTPRRPGEPPRLVVEVDDQLADDHPVAEGDDAGVGLEASVDDEPGHQARVQRSDVTDRRPDVLGAGLERNLLADAGHDDLLASEVILRGARQSDLGESCDRPGPTGGTFRAGHRW